MAADWDLGSFSDALRASSRHKEEERLIWQKELGEPVKFIPDSDSELAAKGFGQGFFKAPWGVIVAQRYANGYSSHTCVQYTTEFIALLTEVDA